MHWNVFVSDKRYLLSGKEFGITMKLKYCFVILFIFIFVCSGCVSEAKKACGSCGELTVSDSKFCPNCGVPLNGDISTTVAETTVIPTTVPKPLTKEEYFLGEDNAYSQIYGAVPVYGDDYQKYLEEMVLSLANAFSSAQLGTHEAQVLINGLIPYNVYENKTTVDEKMSAVYTYFTTGESFANYFTLDFDSSGNPNNCEIKLGNVRAFVEYGIKCGVLDGTWEQFELDASITTFETVCEKMNLTPEVVVGYFAILETYDIEWMEGDSQTLIEHLN